MIGIFLVFCVYASIYTVRHVKQVYERIDSGVDMAMTALADGDEDGLKNHVAELSDFWDQEEDRLIHMIRHSGIDDISKSVARIKALAAGEDYSELTAELSSIRWQMDHIYRSERMILSNLL